MAFEEFTEGNKAVRAMTEERLREIEIGNKVTTGFACSECCELIAEVRRLRDRNDKLEDRDDSLREENESLRAERDLLRAVTKEQAILTARLFDLLREAGKDFVDDGCRLAERIDAALTSLPSKEQGEG